MIFYDKDEQEELLIPAGLGHSQDGDPNLIPANIRKDAEIYGVVGTYEGEKDDLSWIKRAQDGELTDLSGYKLPGGLAASKYGMDSMFNVCWNLTTPPDLSNVTSVGDYGMHYMFRSCSNLTTPPDLSNVTSVGENGMYGMFIYCSSLTTAPDLSGITSVGENGMFQMFYDCRSLTAAPDLSGITSVGYAGMQYMFMNCTSLTAAPDLSGITSVGENGMIQMFRNCSNLSEIKVGWSAWPTASGALSNWVYGVAATGTFHCPPGLPEIFDIHHIPTGWTVIHDIV